MKENRLKLQVILDADLAEFVGDRAGRFRTGKATVVREAVVFFMEHLQKMEELASSVVRDPGVMYGRGKVPGVQYPNG